MTPIREIRLQPHACMVATMPDDARWTMMGFADQLGRRLAPAHRRLPRRAWLWFTLGWTFWLFLVSLAVLSVSLVFVSPSGRQLLRDTAASAGFGTPAPEARLTAIRCDRVERRGRWAISGQRCDVTLSDRGVRRMLDFRVNGALVPDELRGVVRIGDSLGLRWSAGVTLERWIQVAPVALGLALLLPLAWYLGAELLGCHRRLAAIRSGAERDFVNAFADAWHAADPDVANAATARRHQAAAILPLATIDALLARCRAETRRRATPAAG